MSPEWAIAIQQTMLGSVYRSTDNRPRFVHIPLTERACLRCGVVKPIGEFATSGLDKQGEVVRKGRCKPCISLDHRERMMRRRGGGE